MPDEQNQIQKEPEQPEKTTIENDHEGGVTQSGNGATTNPTATTSQNPPLEGEVVEVETVEPTTNPTEETAHNNAPEETELRLARAEAEATDYKNQWLRAVADMKNYKRRAEHEREELKKNANAGLFLKLLPILDDLERAIENIPPEIAESAWWEGTSMIAQKFRLLFESEGVKPIEALDHPFDPNFHHAITYEEAPGKEGLVTSVLQKGYTLHDRVLRPAMVKVGNEQE